MRRAALVAVLAILALPGAAGARKPLTNLAHLDFLGDTAAPPAQAGHTTYRLSRRPRLRALWTYAEPAGGAGRYKRLGGGDLDAATRRWSQGAYNTDDMARAAVVYLRHWRLTGALRSRHAAFGLLRTVAYMQTLRPGPRRGNFVLWMQPDGELSPSAEPKEEPDPFDSADSYWLARSIWLWARATPPLGAPTRRSRASCAHGYGWRSRRPSAGRCAATGGCAPWTACACPPG